MWDTVTLFNTGETQARIPMRIEFDGSVKGGGAVHFSYKGYTANYSSTYGEAKDLYVVEDDILLAPLTGSVTFRVEAAAEVSSISWEGAKEGSYADYTNTMKIKWDLPAGVRFTSASGVFNPQPITPVPEPAAFAPLGLGTLALLKRRRK